jgi:hypothetical protein
MDVGVLGVRNLTVVPERLSRIAGVFPGLGLDRLVCARNVEAAAACEGRSVRLGLEVALVLEPVGDVDHEADEEDEDREKERDKDQDAAALATHGRRHSVRRGPGSSPKSGRKDHAHPAR